MKVLVTGGAGFIGSHIAEALLARGDEVCIVDDLSSGKRENLPTGARFAQLDIRDAKAVSALIGEVKPEVITHQAAQTSVSISTREPIRDAEINVLGSINIGLAAAAHSVKRLVFASTGGAIYGEVPEGTRAVEGDRTTPLSPYACSKLAFEHYLSFFAVEKGLKSTVLRYANVYGPRQDPHGEAGVVAIFARRFKAGEPVQINARSVPGDAGCIRDYVYVADVVRANLAAIDGRIAAPIMNVCTGEPTSTADIAKHLATELAAKSEVRSGPRRAGDLERSVLDPTQCQRILGPLTNLADGLRITAHWFRDQTS
jgi:UDP-glucose 4-epimerase